METALVSAVLKTLAPKIFAFLQGNHELRRNLEHEIQYIRKELNMIAAAIEDHERSSWGNGRVSDVQRTWIQGVRDLAYSIEDSIDRFLHRVTREPGALSFRQKGQQMKTMSVRTKFAAEIRELRRKSEEASKLRELYTSGSQSSTSEASASTFVASNTLTPADELVGMDAPRDEVLELMREDEGQPNRLKVISIVGFGGLGKTVLARQVYDSVAVGEEYDYNPRVWVRASEKGAGDVLKEILRQVQVGMQVHDGSCDDLVECLKFKRFFIVIDDMRTEYWNTIKNAFPKDMGVSSRVIVTTAIHSIANACSADGGHVYVMRTLNDKQSRELFFKQTSLEDYAPAEQVMKKCDGLPLALVTTAQLLQSKCQMTPAGCANLCRYMGEHVENEETLARLKHVLLQNYSSLPGHALKACLLYLSIFPSGHPIKRKCLIRRWLAEGFVEADHRRSAMDVATDNFKALTDRSIIKPIGISNNTEAKTCQTHGMMLEFILQKSIRENFITSLYDQAGLPDKIRRLSLHRKGATRDKINSNVDFSLVRSLTIFGEAVMHIVEFSKYELLRVLDLEECEALKDEHVKKLSNLLMLRYLSLGGNITALPKEISNLKFLETLDVRRAKTQIIAMPIEAIKLPSLIHLLGVFRLPDVRQEMRKLQSFLSKKSSLETLAGFVADQSTEFPQLMRHMTRLTKLKLWCLCTADGSNSCFSHLSSPIQEFIQRGTDVNDAPSLSLNFEGCSQDFLDFNLEENPCYLSSLKLQGELRSLPVFVTKLGSVTELCLSSSGQLSGNVLAALSNVRSLHYLKLITTELDFVIEQGELKALRRLCVVVRSLSRLENQEGALPHLESLWLLCKDLNGLCGARIERLGRIKEVALDDAVSEETRKEWKEAAKKHPRRPRICLVKTKEEIDQMQMGGQTREISHSLAATSPEAENQMQVDSGSEASVVHRKRKLGDLLFFSSRKANGTVATEISMLEADTTPSPLESKDRDT
ncbi:hypothetical protein SETIT_5G230900v2 [Setaria italica]|uniref:NB-ARC domain-containing protein n=1 Tax=Setaria italica TaxID=4555 RepID=K3XE59_SETIT|nr:disease resistance protein RPP13 [Setaria italica]XP_022683016.1 disease resistance protein RPP13 [Setaria italica]RCV26256.1 hypothetical protein SETIT_5G230900v2 [Setaria italica]